MRRAVSDAVLLFFVVVLLGCAAPPTGAPPTAGAAPTTAGSATAAWQRVVDAARREGTVSVTSFPGVGVRDALVDGFQRKYPDIHVDYSGIEIAQIPPKLSLEQSAGQYLTDAVIAGSTTAIASLIPADLLAPVPPYLVGPSTADPTKWHGGRLDYADDAEQYSLVFSAYVKPPFVINTSQARLEDFTTHRELLNPRWAGQIAMRNPTLAGGGQSQVQFWYGTPGLGPDFVRQLITQQGVVFSNDDQQLIDWVARGQYPIGIGISDPLVAEAVSKGLPIRQVPGPQMQEGTYLTAGPGSVLIPHNVPHPNALKVYVDYLLSAEGQAEWVKLVGFPTLRVDVPVDPAFEILVPKAGAAFPATYKEPYVKQRGEVLQFVQSIVPR